MGRRGLFGTRRMFWERSRPCPPPRRSLARKLPCAGTSPHPPSPCRPSPPPPRSVARVRHRPPPTEDTPRRGRHAEGRPPSRAASAHAQNCARPRPSRLLPRQCRSDWRLQLPQPGKGKPSMFVPLRWQHEPPRHLLVCEKSHVRHRRSPHAARVRDHAFNCRVRSARSRPLRGRREGRGAPQPPAACPATTSPTSAYEPHAGAAEPERNGPALAVWDAGRARAAGRRRRDTCRPYWLRIS